MLTRANIKASEAQIESFNLEIGCVTQRKEMADKNYGAEDKRDFHEYIYQMEDRVEKMFVDYQRTLEKKVKRYMREVGNNSKNKGNRR